MVNVDDVFYELKVVSQYDGRIRNEIAYNCVCSCSAPTIATRGQLLNGRKKSCGCARKKSPGNTLDITGMRRGLLVAIERNGMTVKGSALWRCKCDCGEETTVMVTTYRRGDITNCGCQRVNQGKRVNQVLNKDMKIDGVVVPTLTRKLRSDSGSGHKGVHKRDRNGKITYEVSISIKGKRIYGGTYIDEASAIANRKQLEDQYHQPYIDKLEEKQNEKQ